MWLMLTEEGGAFSCVPLSAVEIIATRTDSKLFRISFNEGFRVPFADAKEILWCESAEDAVDAMVEADQEARDAEKAVAPDEFPKPGRRDGEAPCGECHLDAGETCNVCGAVEPATKNVRACRICGCTEEDCSQCVEATGTPCRWVAPDLCSACESDYERVLRRELCPHCSAGIGMNIFDCPACGKPLDLSPAPPVKAMR